MQYGIQRRHIYLVPPEPEDLDYFFDAFEQREVWEMFGFEGPSRKEMERRHREGNLVVGIIRRVEDKRRIGFGVVFPPPLFFEVWEYGIVISDPKDRDLYSAMHASDAMAHYGLDHLRFEYVLWRIRADNRASNAVARRMGYRPAMVSKFGEHRFAFYRLTQEIWAKRRERLMRGEELHPSGIGAFLTLESKPYEPEPLTSSSPKAEPEPPASSS